MQPRTRLVYFYFLRVELLLKTWSQGRRHIVRLPWQRYICRSKYGCFCLSPKVTYLHTKIEEGLKFFISNFASLSWRIALNICQLTSCEVLVVSAKFLVALATRKAQFRTLRLTRRPGDFMKNLETLGKTRKVGRFLYINHVFSIF